MTRQLPDFIQSTFVVTNISSKTVDVLGMRLKPGQSIDLFTAVPGITESKIVEEMRIPNGNLYIESEIKGTIRIDQSEIGTFQVDPDSTFTSVAATSVNLDSGTNIAPALKIGSTESGLSSPLVGVFGEPPTEWTEQSNPKNLKLNAVAYNGTDLWVAVGPNDGTDAYIVTSPDGITWTERANPKDIWLAGIAYSNGLWVATGAPDGTDAYIITSTDGITWTERANPKNVSTRGVAHNGIDLWVVVGFADGVDAYIITSPDGITWTERSNPQNINLFAIAYGNGLWVAVGKFDGVDAYIVTSTDGITWTEQANPKNISLLSVSYGDNLWVAVGTSDGIDAYMITSPDGVIWTEQANPKNIALRGVAYGNGLWVAVGNDDGVDAGILTSPDAITWTEQANSQAVWLTGIVYNNGLWIAVGYDDGTDAYIITSSKTLNLSVQGSRVLQLGQQSSVLQNDMLKFGGVTSDYPALKQVDGKLVVRSADDGYGQLETGSLTTNYTEVSTAEYTATITDHTLGVTRTKTGTCAITLASVLAVKPGRRLIIVDAGGNAGSNTITISTEGSEAINGAATQTITTNYDVLKLTATGADWLII